MAYKNREQQLEYMRKWQQEHPKWYAAGRKANRVNRNLKARQRRVAFMHELKTGKVCVTCGESDISKLDFHHINPATKLFAVGSGDRGIKAIRAEVAKCELLCKPCHLERHKTMKKTP